MDASGQIAPEQGSGGGQAPTGPGKGPAPAGQVDVVEIDPAQVEAVAREWSELSGQMDQVSVLAAQLQATMDDFGLVNQPAGPTAR